MVLDELFVDTIDLLGKFSSWAVLEWDKFIVETCLFPKRLYHNWLKYGCYQTHALTKLDIYSYLTYSDNQFFDCMGLIHPTISHFVFSLQLHIIEWCLIDRYTFFNYLLFMKMYLVRTLIAKQTLCVEKFGCINFWVLTNL